MLSGHGDLTRLGLPLESLLQTWYFPFNLGWQNLGLANVG